jgi:putative SOS response-associated peptidase YedK
MCNRFRNDKDFAAWEREFTSRNIVIFRTNDATPNRGVHGDVRPTDPAFVVRHDGAVETLPWGFPGPRGPVINYRSEGRDFPLDRRALILATAFYETTPPVDPKQKRKDWWVFEARHPFALAGYVRDGRFSLLTADAGPDVVAIHDRQPVVAVADDWNSWLTDPSSDILKPSAANTLTVQPHKG